MATADAWPHRYTRQQAAYPIAALKVQKYWPPVARVDNVYGDKHVFCACVPIDAFKEDEAASASAS
jgi:glycine dehydrogenase